MRLEIHMIKCNFCYNVCYKTSMKNAEEPKHYDYLRNNALVHIWTAKQLQPVVVWIPQFFGRWPETNFTSGLANPGYSDMVVS